ncbi:MAG: TsaC protein [Candidatus Ozemobacter sibiricus]|jgi:L-threonylcarbamoyladenylate synthase|uniref:L-threonylcarbamoyladenylate synthase n=1 Tax=Candidatus Ozemobacter sibiricus TaxID=2268124 RepID=A0A367ZQ63_9BACT|nr:MAG: TsaC protein [Candidatus Ozemobacter sibiricus]
MRRITIPALLADRPQWEAFVQDLRQGGVAALPTDTVYGLAADATSSQGVQAIYEMKGREEGKPLILFLAETDQLGELGIRPDAVQAKLLSTFWPGPLTAVFPTPAEWQVRFPFPSLGIRVPDHPEVRTLLAAYPGFLLTTSCNKSGQPPLMDPDAIAGEFAGSLAWLLDGGPLVPSPPSTVLDLTASPPRILREGCLTRAMLAASGIFGNA